MKKRLSLLLAIVMILGSFSAVFAEKLYEPMRIEDLNIVPEKNENEEVRVIVELVDDPAISYTNGEKYSQLPESTRNRIENNLLAAQEAVKDDISSRGIQMDFINSFTVAFNGFSGTVKRDDIEAIKENPNVKNVYIAKEYERPIVTPDMGSSYKMIGNREIWGDVDGYKGEGMLAAIIDTGIDPDHKDMIITNETQKWTEANVKEKITSDNLPGKFYTDKVPYGYNYFDLNDTITDIDPAPHGMHVAGTVAANGDIENGGIKGVAPEAQLLAMKVFSNDPDFPSTFDDIYMKAIEDAIVLDVDVINMSLGASASFYVQGDPMDKMITEARKSGVLFAVSAGNSAHSLDGIYPGTLAEHPDFGMVGSPSLNKDTISVASVENLELRKPKMDATIGEETKDIPYHHASDSPDPVEVFKDKEVEVVYVGTGEPQFYEGKDVSNKIVLAVRTGNYYYGNIKATAQEKGAAGVLVRGSEEHGDYVNMNIGDPPHTIPMASLSQTDGNMLKDKLEAGKIVKVSFKGEEVQVPNAEAEQISSFSSWGTTPTLDMKPEITAPGGQIYSTLNNNTYGSMSGTSMAAPHVTGGTALVLQYVEKKFTDLAPEDQTAFAKRLLMNTAEPIIEKVHNQYSNSEETNEYSPRLQGAGLMRVDKAVKTPVTVVNAVNGEAKVELRDFTNSKITMNLTAHNHTAEEVKYNIETKVLTNNIEFGFLNTLDCIEVEGAEVGGNGEVKVPANGSKDIIVTIDLSNAELDENVFVEGFIYLTPEQNPIDDEGNMTDYPQLVVPYVGFYGDWAGKNAPRVLDANRFDEDNTFWEVTGMIGNENDYLGFDDIEGYAGWENRVAISPEVEGAYNNIMPILTFMRNAEVAEFNILNERERVVKKLYGEQWISKTHAQNPVYLEFKTLWDGRANGQVVEDGKYYYQVKVKPQYTNAEWQEWKVPVVVDTKVPTITEIKYDEATKTLTWKANDEGIGLNNFTFFKVVKNDDDELERVPITEIDEETGKEYEFTVPAVEVNENGEYQIDLSSYGAFVNFVVVAHDYAENTSEAVAYPTTTFKLESPEAFTLFGEKKVTVSGVAAGYKEVKVKITQGEDVIKVTIPVEPTTGKFSKVVELNSDGIFRINVATVDTNDVVTEDQIPNRIFYVDATEPEILETSSSVVRSKYIENLTAEEALNSPVLLGGGRTVIFVENGIGYAYDRELIKDDILDRFNNADEKYVKLADGMFIDKNGKLTTNIPAVKYFEDKLIVTIKVNVKENFGEFDVYANGQYMGSYGELSLLNPTEFNDWVEFEYEAIGTNEVEIKVVDTLGHEYVETIALDTDNPTDAEATIVEINDIEAETTVFEEFTLPTTVTAVLSNGSVEEKSVEWIAPEGVEIVDGKVTINTEGTYVFTADVEDYGKVILTLEVKPVDKTELETKVAEAKEITDEESYIPSLWTALQEAITKADAVVAKEDATQSEVNEALEALTNAINNLKLNPLLEGIEAKYGAVTDENENAVYVAYVLFNLKDQFADADVLVKVNDETFFEKGADKEGYAFHFSGMIENEPQKVVLIIGEEEYDVTELIEWLKILESEAVQQMIETYQELLNE